MEQKRTDGARNHQECFKSDVIKVRMETFAEQRHKIVSAGRNCEETQEKKEVLVTVVAMNQRACCLVW